MYRKYFYIRKFKPKVKKKAFNNRFSVNLKILMQVMQIAFQMKLIQNNQKRHLIHNRNPMHILDLVVNYTTANNLQFITCYLFVMGILSSYKITFSCN